MQKLVEKFLKKQQLIYDKLKIEYFPKQFCLHKCAKIFQLKN